MDKILPRAAVERLMKTSVRARIGKDAVEEMRTILEDIGIELAKKSKELSEFAGRKTITREDVDLAYQ